MAGKTGRKVYASSAWKRVREEILNDDPRCVLCLEEGRTVAAAEVDHIVPLRDAPDKAFDRGNLRPLCRSCHQRVSLLQALEAGRKRVGCAPDGTPWRRMSAQQQKEAARALRRPGQRSSPSRARENA